MITTITNTTIPTGIRTMIDEFLLRAGLAGVLLSCATGPLGSFVVWRRMAYFGDATAHAAILGVALALATDMPLGLGTLAVAAVMAVTVAHLAGRGWAIDTVLGVMAHSALAFGLVAAALTGARTDLSAWLFGDILAVSWADIGFIAAGAAAVVAVLVWRWQALLISTVDEDLAQASGINPARERLILTLALALTVAVALKVVGALLIAALLIIPAAAARPLARLPERMAVLAALIGAGASLGGLSLSLWQDTPAGPSIIVVAALIFAATSTARR